mmetsp:Transcript_34496/g.67522  ORF Transcript_34496/g.67522 Transcript_34496/m.67522 type:complete len:227 (+) Transcript_34496:125-805(+)
MDREVQAREPQGHHCSSGHHGHFEPVCGQQQAASPASLRPPRYGQDLIDPRHGQANLWPKVQEHDAGAERVGRARYRCCQAADQGLRRHTHNLWHGVQAHHPGRGRQHDIGGAVRAATSDRELHSKHEVLPHLQLRKQDHPRAPVEVHAVPLRAAGARAHPTAAGGDLQGGGDHGGGGCLRRCRKAEWGRYAQVPECAAERFDGLQERLGRQRVRVHRAAAPCRRG